MINNPSWIIPGSSGSDSDITLPSKGSILVLDGNGTMYLEGSVKLAALDLVKYASNEYSHGLVKISFNNVLIISFKDGIELQLVSLTKKPDFWDELVQEFNKIVKMKIFW